MTTKNTPVTIMVHARATDEVAHHVYGVREYQWDHEVSVLDLSERAREWVITREPASGYLENGISYDGVTLSDRYESEPTEWAALATATIEAALDAYTVWAAAEREKTIVETLATQFGQRTHAENGCVVLDYYYAYLSDDPRLASRLVEWQDEYVRRTAENARRVAEEAAASAARKVERERLANVREVAVRAALDECCYSEKVLEQYDRGLLSHLDQRRALVAIVYAVLYDQPRYQRLVAGDVKHTDECCCDDVVYEAGDAEDLTTSEYQTLRAIEQLVKCHEGVVVTPRVHTATCRGCDAEARRVSVRVEITVGDWTLSREYAAE